MAIDDLLDEHEQGERVKAWLRENAVSLIVGISVALAAIFGWRYWQDHRANAAQVPGGQYQAALAQLDQDNIEQAQAGLAELGNHAYASLLALEIASKQVAEGQRDAAIATLTGIRTSDPALQAVVDQRHARLLLDAGKHDEALAALGNGQDMGSLHVRGDIELAAGRADAAAEAYRTALTMADVGSPQRNVLELKLSEVGGEAVPSEGSDQ